MERRGFFGALGAAALSPLALTMGREQADEPVRCLEPSGAGRSFSSDYGITVAAIDCFGEVSGTYEIKIEGAP